MDDIDYAQEREQIDRARAIAAAAHSAPVMLACGTCYYCLDAVPPGLRFCDSACRDDYAALKAAEVRRG